jgi:anti-anti-sigma factor
VFELHQKVYDGPLAVSSTPYGEGVVVVSLGGELDRSNVATAASVIEAVFEKADLLVVIDLQELDFLDSSGVALLADLNGQRGSGHLRIVPSKSLGVARILAATGMDTMLRMVQNGTSLPEVWANARVQPKELTWPAAGHG